MEKCAFGGEMCVCECVCGVGWGGVNSPKNCGCSGKVPTAERAFIAFYFILTSVLSSHSLSEQQSWHVLEHACGS